MSSLHGMGVTDGFMSWKATIQRRQRFKSLVLVTKQLKVR